MDMKEIEEALSIAVFQSLNGRYSKLPKVTKITKYTTLETAPGHHGLQMEFDNGEQLEVVIRKA